MRSGHVNPARRAGLTTTLKKPLVFLFVLALFRPPNLELVFFGNFSLGVLGELLSLVVVAGTFIVLVVGVFARVRISGATLGVAIMLGVAVLSGLLNSGAPIELARLMLPVLGLTLLVDAYAHSLALRELVGIMASVTVALVAINLLTMFLYPDGLYRVFNGSVEIGGYWILGWQKTFGFWVMPAVMTVFLYSIMTKGRLGLGALLVSVVAVVTFMRASATGNLVSLGVAFALLLLLRSALIRRVLPPLILVLVTILWYVAIVHLRLQDRFSDLIVGVFDKNLTLTGRTEIWDSVLLALNGNWWLGLGVPQVGVTRGITVTAHSNYLNLLVYGGAILLVVFICLQWYFAKRVGAGLGRREAHVILSFGIALFLLTATDTAFGVAVYVPIVLAAHLPAVLSNGSTRGAVDETVRKDYGSPQSSFVSRRL